MFFLPVLFLGPLLYFRRNARFAAELAAVALGILFVFAGPWYVRNVVLYRSLSATTDSTTGIGARVLLDSAIKLPWRQSIAGMAHSALWTGNNSFTTFSALTLNVMLALFIVAGILYVQRFRGSPAEIVTVSAVALYAAALVGISLAFFSSSQGAMITPAPWYIPLLFAPAMALCFLGLMRWPRIGRWIAVASVLLCCYIAVATWIVKLVPLYGGYPYARAHARQL